MELEKSIYKLHYSLLSCQLARPLIRTCSIALLIISSLLIILFVALNAGQRESEFANQLKLTKLENDTVYIAEIVYHKRQLTMRFSNNKNLLKLNESIFQSHNFTCSKIRMDFTYYFMDVETLFLVDFVEHFKYQESEIMIQNVNTKEYWYWSQNQLSAQQYPFATKIIENMLVSLQIIIGIFLCSTIAALSIRIIYLTLPLFHVDQEQECAPWLNLYARLLTRNNKKNFFLLLAFLVTLIFYSFVCNQGLDTAAMILFGKSIPLNLNRSFMMIVTANELLSMLFLRTRSSIYFAPKFIFLYQFIFLFYLQKTSYGFYELGLNIMILLSLLTFLLFIYYFEIPALGWQRQSFYTPCETRPRCYYVGLFQISWILDTPQIWTMFYPLCGRKHFERAQLTYVDRNHIQFHAIINDDEHLVIE